MNDNDSLSLKGNALVQFFSDDELIIKREEKALNIEEPESIIHNENHASIVFDGSNKNGLVLLFNHDGDRSIQAIDRPLLERLVENKAALNKSLEESCCINIKNQSFEWQDLLNQINPKQVICWDTVPTGLIIREKNSSINIDGALVLLTDSVSALESNPSLKVPLWNELKSKFI